MASGDEMWGYGDPTVLAFERDGLGCILRRPIHGSLLTVKVLGRI